MDEHEKSKGLAGLSSLVTDVQTIEQQAREQSVSTHGTTSNDENNSFQSKLEQHDICVYTNPITDESVYIQSKTVTWTPRTATLCSAKIKWIHPNGHVVSNQKWSFGSDEGFLFAVNENGDRFTIKQQAAKAGNAKICNRPDLLAAYQWIVDKYSAKYNYRGQSSKPSSSNNQPANRFGCIGVIAFIFLLLFVFAANTGPFKTSSDRDNTINRAQTTSSSSSSKPHNSSQPRGKQTPKKDVATGYDNNHPYLNDNGLCEITIDNTKNDMPVYVRIWDVQQNKPVRAFFIRQGGSFTADELTPGRYEIRYRELYESGEPSHGTKSQVYTMEQHRTPTGTQYDTLSLTLYKVRNGNARTERIDAGDI